METQISTTNRNAALKLVDKKTCSNQVLLCVERYGPQTSEEIFMKTYMSKTGAVARIHELRKKMLLTERGSRTATVRGKKVSRTLYGKFNNATERRNAIDQEWAKCNDERNEIVTALNNLKTSTGKAYQLLHKDYELLTERINELAQMV